ncbi:MAG: hypothetical protein K6T34_09275 [Thermoflavifilum sp.]|nr:hypothetical protein [Thermoflavifilum sp.]
MNNHQTNPSTITLYPSNWLYNAGVIGLLQSMEEIEKIEVHKIMAANGSLYLKLPFFSNLNIYDRYFGEKKISYIVLGKNNLYRNYLQANQKDLFIKFVKALDSSSNSRRNLCNICGSGWFLDDTTVNSINQNDPGKNSKFLDRIRNFSIVHYSDLGPSKNEFPNSFWNLKQSTAVCHLCSFLIIHHHLALTRLSDKSEIFINAPSFEVMYHLNRFARNVLGTSSSEELRTKREILAMSIIEYAIKIQTTLGVWSGMNIEIVSKYGNVIDFFSLTYEVIQLLSDRRIAGLLSKIGEFSIVNLVLDRKFPQLLELGYRLLRIGIKKNRSNSEEKFINEYLRLEKKNKKQLLTVANDILNLYALIEEKKKAFKDL